MANNVAEQILDLKGRRALVTGGSRGIGAATARLLALAGADVAIGYKTRAADADAVAKELRSHGAVAVPIRADICTPEGAKALVAETVRTLGGLDIFVGNAGVWPSEDVPLSAMNAARWHDTLRANLDSIFFSTAAVAQRISDNGRVVLISSTAGQRGEAFHADYAATKGAVISITKSLAIELAPRGITVNCVAPGWVDTEMISDAMQREGAERIRSGIPLGRIALPSDIAGPVVFLCSELGRHITGEILNVNGGSVMCG
jgi:3-oxoacyl-[acyl-carrier protein] reductase